MQSRVHQSSRCQISLWKRFTAFTEGLDARAAMAMIPPEPKQSNCVTTTPRPTSSGIWFRAVSQKKEIQRHSNTL
jgi:hypothetical protein